MVVSNESEPLGDETAVGCLQDGLDDGLLVDAAAEFADVPADAL